MKKTMMLMTGLLLLAGGAFAVPTPTPDCSICQGGLFCDAFEYPNNSIASGDWTERSGVSGPGLSVVQEANGNNVAQLDPSVGNSGWDWVIHNSFGSLGDQDFEANITQAGAPGSLVCLALRASGLTAVNNTPDDCYIFQVDSAVPANLVIYMIHGGFWFSSYNFATGTATIVNPAKFRMRFKVVGNQFTAYIDGVQVLSAADTITDPVNPTIPTGSIGLVAYSSPAHFDEMVLNKGLACPAPSMTATPTASPTATPTITLTWSETPSFTDTPSPADTVTASPTVTQTPDCSVCRGGIFCDDFEGGTNSVSNALWTYGPSSAGGSLSVVVDGSGTHVAQLDPNGGWSWALHNSYSGLGDQDFESLITQPGVLVGLLARAVAGGGAGIYPDHCYVFQCYTSTVPASVKIYKVLDGSGTSLDLVTGTAYVADSSHFHMRFSATGTQLKAYIENVQVLSTSDSDYSSGSIGLLTLAAPSDFDEMLLNAQCPGPVPTMTQTFTYSPTPDPSVTPAFQKSNFGDLVLGPMPAIAGSTICLYFAQEPSASTWDIYNTSGERVAHLAFTGSLNHCWNTTGMSPGLYYAKLSADWAAGGSATANRKIVLVK